MAQHKKAARVGGEVAARTRKDIEKESGRKIVTSKNAKQLHQQIEQNKEDNKK